ncbi:hypothetical protein KIW84_012540 [Lathyrus oleraceus]|uniref:ATP-dependent DNA helicase n=1 Tax=Pisum sativum TaxID=3888 RepID=A0A9D5BHZ3_PEA|nr:hypothetical protein KIW84_012540 [Pisum sativum]
MRSLHDQEFAEFLIRIVDGVEPTKPDDMVRLPLHIAISWEGEHSIQVLIQHIFPNLELHDWDAPYMVQRAILTPTNDDVQKLNDMIINQFPGEEHNLLSFDEVEGDNHNLYQQEFLNSIAQVIDVLSGVGITFFGDIVFNFILLLALCISVLVSVGLVIREVDVQVLVKVDFLFGGGWHTVGVIASSNVLR